MRGRKARVTPNQRTVAAYIRVSTQEQADGGHSLPAQQRRLEALAIGHDRAIEKVYVDAGVSAKTLNRPQLSALLEQVRAGKISAVYVSKLDRLSRNLRDLLDLVKTFDKHDVALVSASETVDTGTPIGRAMLSLLGVFAELEREQIGERTREVLGDRRRERKVYGPIPFGYKREGENLVEIPEDLAIRTAAQMMYREDASLRQIAAMLKERTGRPWAAQTVKKMLGSRMSREQLAAA